MEKWDFVDQKTERKFLAIREFVLGNWDAFRRQGSVVPSWRTYRGRRLGPFFSLRFRLQGRQSAIYLGRSAGLAERVKALLDEVHRERKFARLKRRARAEFRELKRRWKQELAATGLELRGFEIRGWNRMSETSSPWDSDRSAKEGTPCGATRAN
ncbi:MAG: hypothetical protein NTY19_44440 [Planctomycetota bacterium]|nr:hypothetical protein [Planctomycetota bacterium]